VNPLWFVAVSVDLPSFTWMVVRWRESTVYHRISERALEDCPAQQRPGILRALAATVVTRSTAWPKPPLWSGGGQQSLA
jgi:hypothetical protein